MRRIGIVQFLTALDGVVEGFRRGLTELGLKEGPDVVYEYRNVEGNVGEIPAALDALCAKGVDLVFACATPPAKAAAARSADRPVIFAPVFDPVKAGLVASLERPGGHVTGVSGMVLPKLKLPMLRQAFPEATSITVLHSSGDPNALTEADALTAEGGSYGLAVTAAPVGDDAELAEVLPRVVSSSSLILLSLDRWMDERLDTVISAATAAKAPLIAHNAAGVKRGALCAIEADNAELGRLAAEQAMRILSGADPAWIAVQFPSQPRLVFNSETAREIGFRIPSGVRPDVIL